MRICLWLRRSAAEQADDSNGYVSGLMERFGNLHFKAAMIARLEPQELAAKLFHAEMASGFGEWDSSAARYAEVLGAEGLAAYRALAEAVWAKTPVKTQSDERYDTKRYQITRIMEDLARSSGNVEELVAVLERAAAAARSAEKSDAFETELNALLKKFKVKRNFLKRVEQRKRQLLGQGESK